MAIGFTEPLGATTLLHGKVTASDEVLTASLPGVYQSYSQGDLIRLTLAAENIHLFDVASGARYDRSVS